MTEEDGRSLNSLLLPHYETDSPARNSCWWKAVEGLFDLFSIVVFAADVTLDILITIQFYQLQHMTFFWISIALFLVSQFVYSALFGAVFLPAGRNFLRTFVCIFPFAQLVPFIIFAHSFNWRWMDSLLRKLADEHVFDPEQDPLKHFIKVKIDQHGGFVAEALVESLPQSILQVVALVITNEVDSPLAIISIVLSMVSLASRGVMLSYSLDLWTRIFDIWCFVVDVFSLFATVLWLFFTFQGQELVPVFPGLWEQPVAIVSAWWIYKECVLAGLWLCFGMAFFAYPFFVVGGKKVRSALFFLGLLVLFLPAMVALECSRFWPLAIWLTRSENAMDHKLWKWLFWFLNNPQTIDGVEVDPGFMEKHRLINLTIMNILGSKMRTRADITEVHLQKLEITAHSSNYSFSALRGLHFNLREFPKSFFSEDKLIWHILLALFPSCVVFPYTILSSLLSLAFPFVMLCSMPFEAVPLLHKAISFAYFGSLLVWLLLAIKAFPFTWMRLHIFHSEQLSTPDSAARFREDLTQAFDNARSPTYTQQLLPLPSVLSALVAGYAFGTKRKRKALRR